MALSVQREVSLFKIETSYGVDAEPAANTNALLTQPVKQKIISRSLERNNVKPYFGAEAPVNIGDGIQLDFVTELKGNGSAGVVPEIGPLFRAANYTEAIQSSSGAVAWQGTTAKNLNDKVTPVTPNGYYYLCTTAGTTGGSEPTWPTTDGQTVADGTVTWTCKKPKVDYDPHSDFATAESGSFYYYFDGKLRKALGCRANPKVDMKAGEYVKIAWTLTGIYAGTVDEALVDPTYNQTIPPRLISSSFSIDSYAAVVENISIDGGNKVVPRSSVNAATGISEYFIADREVVGSIDPEDVLNSEKNFESMWSASSRVAFSATVGASAGNKCVITGPKVALKGLDEGERNGLRTKNIDLVFTPDSGNDEIKFSFQ